MLDYLGEKTAARRLEQAVAKVIAEGKFVTYDLKPNRDDPSAVGTAQMADTVMSDTVIDKITAGDIIEPV